MSKAKELLEKMASVLKVDCDVFIKHQFDEAIAELEQFADEAESIRMLCDDRAERISELEEQEVKSCKDCKFSEADDQACTILTHAVLESDAMPKTFYCSLFRPKDPQ